MDRDPVVELELVLGPELLVLAVVAEDQRSDEIGGMSHAAMKTRLADEALEPVEQAVRHQVCSWGSISREATREPRWTVKRSGASSAAARPASLPVARPTIRTASATIQALARPVAPSQPIAAFRSGLASAGGRAVGGDLDAVAGDPGAR